MEQEEETEWEEVGRDALLVPGDSDKDEGGFCEPAVAGCTGGHEAATTTTSRRRGSSLFCALYNVSSAESFIRPLLTASIRCARATFFLFYLSVLGEPFARTPKTPSFVESSFTLSSMDKREFARVLHLLTPRTCFLRLLISWPIQNIDVKFVYFAVGIIVSGNKLVQKIQHPVWASKGLIFLALE